MRQLVTLGGGRRGPMGPQGPAGYEGRPGAPGEKRETDVTREGLNSAISKAGQEERVR